MKSVLRKDDVITMMIVLGNILILIKYTKYMTNGISNLHKQDFISPIYSCLETTNVEYRTSFDQQTKTDLGRNKLEKCVKCVKS